MVRMAGSTSFINVANEMPCPCSNALWEERSPSADEASFLQASAACCAGPWLICTQLIRCHRVSGGKHGQFPPICCSAACKALLWLLRRAAWMLCCAGRQSKQSGMLVGGGGGGVGRVDSLSVCLVSPLSCACWSHPAFQQNVHARFIYIPQDIFVKTFVR